MRAAAMIVLEGLALVVIVAGLLVLGGQLAQAAGAMP